MKPIKFQAQCTQTIEHFKKKHIIAICVDKDSRLPKGDMFNLMSNLQSHFVIYKGTRFVYPLYEAVAAINHESLGQILENKERYISEIVNLARIYKDVNINHFVNIWIEKNYDNDCIIVDAKFIEQYAFLFNSKAYIIKVVCQKEDRNFNQPLINDITKPNFILPLNKINHENVMIKLFKDIESFMSKKDNKNKMPIYKPKRKRTSKK